MLIAGLLVVALVLVLDAVHALHGLDLASSDWRFAVRGAEGPAHEVTIVGVDDKTFDYLKAHHLPSHFPLARRLDARVINNLKRAGAKVIAVDVQYTESTDPTDDNALILAVRHAGNVVLATTEVSGKGKTGIFGGGQGLAFSRATPAESQFPVDSDGEIRRMNEQILHLHTFPVAAAQKAQRHPIPFPGGAGATALIDFRGPAHTLPFTSYGQILSGHFDRAAFRNKIVVIGDTESIFHDVHQTSTDDLMTGAEVQANAIDTVLRGFPLAPLPTWLNVLLVLAMGMVAPLLALRLTAVWMTVVTAGVVLVFVAASQLAFDAGIVVGVVAPVVAAALSLLTTLLLRGARVVFEREQVRDAFARFVPESVVSEVLAQADGVRLGGVRRYVTVLFSDLRGFTTFSERRQPDETLGILNRYLTAMTDAILEHGGTLVSYMGDGIMAVFGAPLDQPDHADRALSAARDMVHRLADFNQSLRAEGHGDGFKMGIGLNSGEVMSGNVGSERRLEYTTIGDTTNTASRIEGMTKGTPYQLFLAESTYNDLSDKPDDLVPAGEFEVRGRSTQIKIWALADDSVRAAEAKEDAAPPAAEAEEQPAPAEA